MSCAHSWVTASEYDIGHGSPPWFCAECGEAAFQDPIAAAERIRAAAPAMLAMLQEIVAADDAAIAELAQLGLDPRGMAPITDLTDRARALIAIATGSKPCP